MEKISRKQAWAKLAVLIATPNLPEPTSVSFLGGIWIDLDSPRAYEQWVTVLGFGDKQQRPHDTETKRLYRAWDMWHGWHLSINASTPLPADDAEPLTHSIPMLEA
jgi:hypothetical protein